jgi:hypothetical protein
VGSSYSRLVLLHSSLSTAKPYDIALALVAMLYGLAVLWVFAFFTRITSRQAPTEENSAEA